MNPPAIYDIGRAFTIVQYLAAEIAQATVDAGLEPFSRVVITTGQAADDECTCGSLAITLNTVFRSNGFPRDDSGSAINCVAAEVAFSGTVRALRCAPEPSDNGQAPTVDQLAASAAEVLQDAFIVMTTLQCRLFDLKIANPPQLADGIVGQQTLLTHAGGCAGSETSFQFAFLNNFCGC